MPTGIPRWLLIIGTLLAAVLAGVVSYAALNPEAGILPYRLQAWLDNAVGDGKVIQPQADPHGVRWAGSRQAEPEAAAEEDDSAAPRTDDEAPPTGAGDSGDPLAHVRAAGVTASEAITAFAAHPEDPTLARQAQSAVDTIRSIQVSLRGEASQAAAVEVRDELARARQKDLDAAKMQARVTHEVVGTSGQSEAWLVVRAAADAGSRDLAHLTDGDQVHVFLQTGSGWSRVEVLSGPHAGTNGYAKDKFLRKIKTVTPAKVE